MARPDDVTHVYEPQEGMFVTGLPQRDLTQADIDRLRPSLVAHGMATGLYRKASKQEREAAAKDAEKAEKAKAGEAAGDGER
jgi:hypothetical protein